MLSACVQYVNSMGFASRKSVNTRPQSAINRSSHPPTNVYKSPKLPTIHPRFSHLFPHQIIRKLPPLQSLFSPLSTPPITTTTN
jgi:hypothetical protein